MCDCGQAKVVRLAHLRHGKIVSCGCVGHAPKEKHGLRHIPEYLIWKAMNERCTRVKCQSFKNYGGRGIKVCDRWRHDFKSFYEDMGPRPSPNHSIDRKDNDGNYEPGNCRWATAVEQRHNRRPVKR